MAVGVIFNTKPTHRTIAHESQHVLRFMMELGLDVRLDDCSDEAWAYMAGWIADCMYDFVETIQYPMSEVKRKQHKIKRKKT